jgi:hypothetical protein
MTGAPFPRHLRLAEKPPRLRRLVEVRITVRDREPIGRSRGFRISDRDIDELIIAAQRLEAQR